MIGRRWVGSMTVFEIHEATERLLAIASGRSEEEVKAKAVAAAVRMLTLTRNPDQLASLEKIIPTFEEHTIDPYQRLHILLARAWTLGARRQLHSALAILSEAVTLAEKEDIRSSIAVRLLLGQGNVLCLLGRYQESLQSFEIAATIAKKLDNLTLQGEAAVQTAVASGRLGDSQAQVDQARRASKLLSESDWSPAALSARYELACGLAQSGQFTEAQVAIENFLAAKPRHLPPWVMQAASLCIADVMWLCGKDRRAYNHAKKAIDGNSGLENVAYAGLYARWVALLGIRSGQEVEALDRLTVAFNSHTDIDVKDQAEVLAARILLQQQIGDNCSQDIVRLQAKLAALPPGIGKLMRQLKIISSGKSEWGIK